MIPFLYCAAFWRRRARRVLKRVASGSFRRSPRPSDAKTPVPKCIFCDNDLTDDTMPEHILLNAYGGRKTTKRVNCSVCNNRFGGTIDKEAGEQVAVIRNLLQLESGTGRAPPMLPRVQAGNDTINILSDGNLELVAKPFTVTDLGEGRFDIRIMTKSLEDLARYIPHIAARMGCTAEQVLEQLKSATGSSVERRPDTVLHPIGLGSAAKSSLVLWAMRVGNDEVKSPAYAAARDFVVAGNETLQPRPRTPRFAISPAKRRVAAPLRQILQPHLRAKQRGGPGRRAFHAI
jgi:hypothetical protein